jgi:predicted DNA-binding mobile mystery protein A
MVFEADRSTSRVLTYQSIMRRQLDKRLTGVEKAIGPRPPEGWIRTIRKALGMSTSELAERMSISKERAWKLEQTELEDSLRLSTLRRAAEALNCRLLYVFAPEEPLEDMVLRQAALKVEEEHSLAFPFPSDRDAMEEDLAEEVEARALELIDRRGLWRSSTAAGRPKREL